MKNTEPVETLIPVGRLHRGRNLSAPREGRPAVAKGDVDVKRLWKRLREGVEGEVRFDPASRRLYAQDASNYYHVPLGVVLPKNAGDVLATLAACRELGAPIVSRTGGTGLAGQACNEAVVIDFSKYMRRILAIDPQARTARVEPGVVCDELTDAAKAHRLTWGPKPATHSRCGFGGMLSNNCGGMNAHYAGIAVHNVEALDVALYDDGTRLHLDWMTEGELERAIARGDAAGNLLRGLRDLRDRYASRIVRDYPKLARRVSGYNLDELLPKQDGRLNWARALVGTEGGCDRRQWSPDRRCFIRLRWRRRDRGPTLRRRGIDAYVSRTLRWAPRRVFAHTPQIRSQGRHGDRHAPLGEHRGDRRPTVALRTQAQNLRR